MGFVNWMLVGFWGCAITLGWFVFLLFEHAVHQTGRPAEDIENFGHGTVMVLSFIGMCLFGAWLWN